MSCSCLHCTLRLNLISFMRSFAYMSIAATPVGAFLAVCSGLLKWLVANSVAEPAVPRSVLATATGVSGQVRVSFTNGTHNGGEEPTYNVTVGPGGVTAAGRRSPILVNGLVGARFIPCYECSPMSCMHAD